MSRPSTPATPGLHPNQVRTVRQQIEDYIIDQRLRPGDPMPTELELCEQLQVSRSSVREAMRTLAALDIVEVRHGTGTFVGHLSLTPLVNSVAFRSVLAPGEANEALRNIVEVRTALEIGQARQVVTTLKGKPNPELESLVSQMVELAGRGESFAHQDRQFHRELLSQTSNDLLVDVVDAFWEAYTILLHRLEVATPEDITDTASAHGQMLDAARAGDLDAYLKAVDAHYRPLLRVLDRSAEPTASGST